MGFSVLKKGLIHRVSFGYMLNICRILLERTFLLFFQFCQDLKPVGNKVSGAFFNQQHFHLITTGVSAVTAVSKFVPAGLCLLSKPWQAG